MPTLTYPFFMSHPFWEFLKIDGENDLLPISDYFPEEDLKNFYSLILQGFYPVSYCSALGFKRFSELCSHETSRNIANKIYEIELGKHPLIPGSKFKNVLHCDQLKALIESISGYKLNIPQPFEFNLINKLNFDRMNVIQALAVCDVIENTAPYVIHFYQDFTVRCQAKMKIPSERVVRTYLDEHNLTEGSDCEEQHVEMLDKMKEPFNEFLNTAEYEAAVLLFNSLCNEHFSNIVQQLKSLEKNLSPS